jgi:hypothetical protein
MFEIGKKARNPRKQMFHKEVAISTGGGIDPTTNEACHDFTKRCGVILWLRVPRRFFDTETLQGFA